MQNISWFGVIQKIEDNQISQVPNIQKKFCWLLFWLAFIDIAALGIYTAVLSSIYAIELSSSLFFFFTEYCLIDVCCWQENTETSCKQITRVAFSCTSWLALGVSCYFQNHGKNFDCGMTRIRWRASNQFLMGW